MNVFITGVGCISAIGNNVPETLKSLLNDTHGLTHSELHNLILGSISLSNEELESINHINRSGFSRTVLIGYQAAKEAWGDNVSIDDVQTGFISGTSVGELDITENLVYSSHENQIAITDLLTEEAGASTEKIADLLGLKGYVNTISTACSSGANAILLGARLIMNGRLDRILVGASDPLVIHNIKGFGSLNICDPEFCTPFDANRKGLNLGEGAAYILLENEHSLSRTKNTVIGRVSGWGNAADAFHHTASSPEGTGATLSMIEALKIANLHPNQIDYINAHGTGTFNNDLSESRAIEKVFKENLPNVSSTKAYTGHCLAAAGSVEAVLSLLAIQQNFVPANLRFKEKIPEVNLEPAAIKIRKPINHVLSNSFGFGGNCTSLIFSKS